MPEELTQSQQTFYDMLYSRRKAMGAGNRARSSGKVNAVWLYPYQYERAYAKGISKIQRDLINYSQGLIFPLLEEREERLDYVEDPADWKTFKTDIADWLDPEKDIKLTYDEELKQDDSFQAELKIVLAAIQAEMLRQYGPDSEKVRALITATALGTTKWNDKQAQKFYKGLLGVEFITTEPWEKETIDVWTERNLSLIRGLSDEYIKNISGIVADGVLEGATAKEIEQRLLAEGKKIKGYRARLIARDQVGKLNGVLTKRRMADAGISMYEWSTAGDERVRARHKPLDNKLCRWDDDTVYSDDKGVTWKSRSSIGAFAGIPGQDMQCRCTASPVFQDMVAEVDKQIKEEKNAA